MIPAGLLDEIHCLNNIAQDTHIGVRILIVWFLVWCVVKIAGLTR